YAARGRAVPHERSAHTRRDVRRSYLRPSRVAGHGIRYRKSRRARTRNHRAEPRRSRDAVKERCVQIGVGTDRGDHILRGDGTLIDQPPSLAPVDVAAITKTDVTYI